MNADLAMLETVQIVRQITLNVKRALTKRLLTGIILVK